MRGVDDDRARMLLAIIGDELTVVFGIDRPMRRLARHRRTLHGARLRSRARLIVGLRLVSARSIPRPRWAAEQEFDETAAEIGLARLGVALPALPGARIERLCAVRTLVRRVGVGSDLERVGRSRNIQRARQERGHEDTPHCSTLYSLLSHARAEHRSARTDKYRRKPRLFGKFGAADFSQLPYLYIVHQVRVYFE